MAIHGALQFAISLHFRCMLLKDSRSVNHLLVLLIFFVFPFLEELFGVLCGGMVRAEREAVP